MKKPRLEYKLRETELAIVLLDLIGSTAFVQKVGPVKAARCGRKAGRVRGCC